MAGWSILKNGSAFDCVEIVTNCQGNGCCLDDDHAVKDSVVEESNEYEVRLRSLFDQVLSVFLEEVASRDCMRPVPAMLGDGRSPDMLKLFLLVRERGGFDSVSRDGLWALVAKELGCDRRVLPSVKLIYFKYLNELEKWLRGNFRDRRLGNEDCECGGGSSFLSLELETEFRGLLTNALDQKVKDNRISLVEYKKKGKYVDKDIKESELKFSNTNSRYRRCGDDDEKTYDDDERACNDLLISDPSFAKKLLSSRKRKRKSLSGMLNWLIQIAKCPKDPSIGAIPYPSKWKEHRSEEYWAQVIRAREALLERRHVDSNTEESLLQSNQKMNPSMYEDCQQSTERLRCSDRLPALVKSRLCSCCNSCSASHSKSTSSQKSKSPQKTKSQNGFKEQAPEAVYFLQSNTTIGQSGNEYLVRHVSVGLLFQAEVPEWTGVAFDSDSKWLGTRIWPLENGEQSPLIERDLIGKGRPDSCSCRLPGSVECFRFHIAEKRMKLKLALGTVFYKWRFDRMGEEVSLRWTVGEENTFKNMVTLNAPSPSVSFWDNASKCFHRKTREDLVSYYLNVFLIQRRSYQNRVTPKHIDSDDDESEFGSVSYSFGHEAVKVPGSNMLICSQNNQCTDLE